MKLVSVSEMVAVEKAAVEAGLSYGDMMENAAKGLADYIDLAYSQAAEKTVLGLVGKGNNGGDTLIALALLVKKGWQAAAYIIDGRDMGDGLPDRLIDAGGEVFNQDADKRYSRLRALIGNHNVLLDGILGTGVKLPLKDPAAILLRSTKKALSKKHPSSAVVAVDCPSGVDCDSGAVADETIAADATVCMAAVKQGLLRLPAFEYVGEMVLVDIGLPAKLKQWKTIDRLVISADFVREHLPPRPLEAHKGTFGTAMVVAGSVNYTGAAYLAGEAAYRIGAGLVSMAVPQSIWGVLAGVFPEAVWIPLHEEGGAISQEAVRDLQPQLKAADSLLIGPGFGLAASTRQFLRLLLSGGAEQRSMSTGLLKDSGIPAREGASSLPPTILDADGLKLLADIKNWHEMLPSESVLTPHPGEMARLTGLNIAEIQYQRMDTAQKFAAKWKHVVVLKGAFTVIASPRGKTAVIPAATPALASAGSGDVLAGMIAGLLAQGVAPFEAACTAAWLHAQAGLQAARKYGSAAPVLARDLIANLPGVMKSLG